MPPDQTAILPNKLYRVKPTATFLELKPATIYRLIGDRMIISVRTSYRSIRVPGWEILRIQREGLRLEGEPAPGHADTQDHDQVAVAVRA